MPRPWRVVRSYCQGRPEIVGRQEARERLAGYYDLKEAFARLLNGERLPTAAHEYWFEFEGEKDDNNIDSQRERRQGNLFGD